MPLCSPAVINKWTLLLSIVTRTIELRSRLVITGTTGKHTASGRFDTDVGADTVASQREEQRNWWADYGGWTPEHGAWTDESCENPSAARHPVTCWGNLSVIFHSFLAACVRILSRFLLFILWHMTHHDVSVASQCTSHRSVFFVFLLHSRFFFLYFLTHLIYLTKHYLHLCCFAVSLHILWCLLFLLSV